MGKKLRSITDSPFLRDKFSNPLNGAALSWMTSLSDALQGGWGAGNVLDGAGLPIGEYKSFGGLCRVAVKVVAGTTTITMPSTPQYRGPMDFSDGQKLWGSVDGDGTWTITITTTAPAEGFSVYWS